MLYLVGGALVVGLSLGLLGSGGSILTVPVLVYLLDHAEKIAIAESLAIVGAISFAGALPFVARRLVSWRSVLFFGVPGMLGTYAGAWGSKLVSGSVQLAVFAGVMLTAAWMMARRQRALEGRRSSGDPGTEREAVPTRHVGRIAADGLVVGIITGLVGVGGGFLIVPALVVLGGLPMHRAIGTSLLIIALKSFTGFAKYLGVLDALGLAVDAHAILWFSAIGIAASILGGRIGARLRQEQLRRGFAVVLVVMAILILVKEVPKL